MALGNRRFLDLFGKYFEKTHGVESRHWLSLFSEKLHGPHWKRIIFIGKDREHAIRKRWAKYSADELIFIEMYPDRAFPEPFNVTCDTLSTREKIHVEDYQLRQLEEYNIPPFKPKTPCRPNSRIIVYPEEKITKEKLSVDIFLALYDQLVQEKLEVCLLKPAGLEIPRGFVIDNLSDVKTFFREGGIFVSNDSGMAHLAGACGLSTLTVFTRFDPVIWHPRGNNISITPEDDLSIEGIKKIIFSLYSSDRSSKAGA
ncbi:MAG: glycosyltransferase family 9 protein [Syntrophorhabdus sp.]